VDCGLNPNHATQSLNNYYTPIPFVTCINMHHFPCEPPKAPQQHFENETKQVMQIFNSIQQHNQVLTLELEEQVDMSIDTKYFHKWTTQDHIDFQIDCIMQIKIATLVKVLDFINIQHSKKSMHLNRGAIENKLS